MAANNVVSSLKLCSFLVFLSFIAADSKGVRLKETKMTLFIHDFFGGGPNATDAVVAGIPCKEWGFFKFGTIAVLDDLMTEDIQLHSKPIARAQGTSRICSLDGINAQTQLSILFTNEKYNGSTLELQGLYYQLANMITELAIVSGTGAFRFARGFATFEYVHYDSSISYDVVRSNITLRHYS